MGNLLVFLVFAACFTIGLIVFVKVQTDVEIVGKAPEIKPVTPEDPFMMHRFEKVDIPIHEDIETNYHDDLNETKYPLGNVSVQHYKEFKKELAEEIENDADSDHWILN